MRSPRRFLLPLATLAVAAAPYGANGAATFYVPLEPFEMALAADVIVEGTIVQVDRGWVRWLGFEPRFTIRVDRAIAGASQGRRIEVRQFEDWTCAARYAPYEVGQRAIFHLVHPRDAEGRPQRAAPPRVMSGGNEGEWPVDGSVVVRSTSRWDDMKPGTRTVNGHAVQGVVAPRDEVLDALGTLRRLHRWVAPAGGLQTDLPCAYVRATGTEDERRSFRASSSTADSYVAAMEACRHERVERGHR